MIARISLVFLLLYSSALRAQGVHSTSLPEAARLPHPPGVALVLSGGGIKGFAHIGVLDVLDSAHVPIDLIVGTSIGAVVGGLYAAGYTPKQLEEFARKINWADVLEVQDESHRAEKVLSQKDDRALLSLRFTGFFSPVLPQAISSGERLTMLLNSMVLGAPEGVPHDFLRDMRVPFVAVVTDIVRGERRLLTSGDLTEALRASATLPLRFSPMPGDTDILMDGGLISNIPSDVARSFGAEKVIVVNATAHLHPREALTNPLQIIDQSEILMMQQENTRELQQSDCTITPELDGLDESDFSNIPAMIEAGREAARKMLPAIQRTEASVENSSEPKRPVNESGMFSSIKKIRVLGSGGQTLDTTFLSEYLLKLYSIPSALDTASFKTIEHEILENYRSHGYSLARIDSLVIRLNPGVAEIYLEAGHIGRIRVEGALDSDFAIHELTFGEGDVFHAKEGESSLKNLTGTGLFDFALLRIQYDTLWPGTRYVIRNDGQDILDHSTSIRSYSLLPTIVVTVHSMASRVIRLGAFADNEFGAEFSTELADENLGGTGILGSVKGSLGPLTRSAALTFDAPRLLHTFAVLDASAYAGYRDINVYSAQTVTNGNRLGSTVTDEVRESRDFGVSLLAGGQFERLGEITVQMRAEHQRWASLRDSTTAADNGDIDLRAVRVQLLVDSRDDIAYPHTGTLVRGYYEEGLLGTNYTKFFGEIAPAIPLSALHTIIPRIRLGVGTIDLPLLEEFRLGGMESFYGLNEYELIGKQMVEGSLTYQIAIPHVLFFPTFVAIRYDVGSTWPEPAQIKFATLVHGAGAQVGLKTPLGLARFGIGENFRFTSEQAGEAFITSLHSIALNSPRFYFSIGSKL